MQNVLQQNEQQKQDIEKLMQANGASKQKLQRMKVKSKKLVGTKKRTEIKIKIMEQKINQAKAESIVRSAHKSTSKIRSRKASKNGAVGYPDDNECYDQLQTQLEINQILIDKLDMMGVDVRELIRSQSQVAPAGGSDDQQNVRMVIFTFVGPEGLIEGGDNQQFEMPVDFNQVVQVDQIKDILKKELVMDAGIDLILREKQSGQSLDEIQDVHIAVDSGDGILV